MVKRNCSRIACCAARFSLAAMLFLWHAQATGDDGKKKLVSNQLFLLLFLHHRLTGSSFEACRLSRPTVRSRSQGRAAWRRVERGDTVDSKGEKSLLSATRATSSALMRNYSQKITRAHLWRGREEACAPATRANTSRRQHCKAERD